MHAAGCCSYEEEATHHHNKQVGLHDPSAMHHGAIAHGRARSTAPPHRPPSAPCCLAGGGAEAEDHGGPVVAGRGSLACFLFRRAPAPGAAPIQHQERVLVAAEGLQPPPPQPAAAQSYSQPVAGIGKNIL